MLFLEDARDLVVDRLRLPRVAARRDHEEVGEVADTTHVEDRDVGRQLLLAESGGTACLLEWCQVGLSRVLVGFVSVYSGATYRPSRAIASATLAGTEIVDRLAACDTSSDLRRGDRDGLHVELDDSIRCGESPSHRLDLRRGRHPAAWRRRVARAREHAAATSRSRTSASSSAPEHEVRHRPDVALRASRPCGRARSSSTTASGSSSNARRVELEPRLGRGRRVSCGPDRRRRGRGARSSRSSRTAARPSATMAVVRRIEDPAEDPGHCHSSSSSPTSTCVPRLIPSPRRAASSSSGGGGVPTTR